MYGNHINIPLLLKYTYLTINKPYLSILQCIYFRRSVLSASYSSSSTYKTVTG